MAEEELVLADVMNMLEAEPSSGAAEGKAKEALGVQLTHEQVKRLSDKDVEKYTKRYETYVRLKTTDSLVDSVIFLVSKAVGMVADITDINDYQRELKNDYIINQELSILAGSAALKCGRFLALANAALITTKTH
ncbi:hypothetical protein OS493_022407 [Desmophyllum pertusum]|uniref:Uncharacterized protein n=1 Tax=Desmophyllum pertusum TaxID=174260 RepID=A0A9X0A102_9CNID|nr:hypothetical protein OS493_022407 [Desmophyllum pertusum]